MSLDAGRIAASPVDTTGLLTGSWFSAITWGVETFQLAVYLTRYTKDSVVLKSAVIFIFCADTAWNVLLLISTYFHLIVVQPLSLASFVPTISLPIAATMSSTTIFGVNLFLIHRYRKLTQRTWISISLLILALASFACHLWATIAALTSQKLDGAGRFRGYEVAAGGAKAGLALEVTMVCLIWLLLLFHFLSLLRQEMQGTRRIIERLAMVTLESGTCVSAVSIASLIYYLGHPRSTNSIVLGLFIARVYFMNMLFNLNMRGSGGILMREIWSQSRGHRITGDLPDLTGVQLSQLPSSSTGDEHSRIQHSVVHVSQSVATHLDKEKEDVKERELDDHL